MRWMWIDRVVELDPGRRLVAVKAVSLAEEHLHDHFSADADTGRRALPVMPASLIIEGMAQSGGILVGHAQGFREKVILAKITRAELERDATPGCVLRYTAEVERLDEIGASTRGTVELLDLGSAGGGGAGAAGGGGEDRGSAGSMGGGTGGGAIGAFEVIGRIDLLFSHLDRNQGAAGASGQAFPEHNFVFGESFRTLLRSSGVEID